MTAKQPGVSGAYLKLMYWYDAAACENAPEESLDDRAAVHQADRLQSVLHFRPVAHQMPPPGLLNGLSIGTPRIRDVPGFGRNTRRWG
jgi:hypothetical protein